MTTITIPKKLAKKDDLVVLPRREYEALKEHSVIKEFTPTSTQKRALVKAEQNFRRGKTFSYDELAKKMGFEN